MKITLNITLSANRVNTISALKGYSPNILIEWVETPNPISADDFLKSVYESMLKADIASTLIEARKKAREEDDRTQEQVIRDSIEITSGVN